MTTPKPLARHDLLWTVGEEPQCGLCGRKEHRHSCDSVTVATQPQEAPGRPLAAPPTQNDGSESISGAIGSLQDPDADFRMPGFSLDSSTAPEIAAKAFEEVERQTPRCSRCSATHAGSAGGLTSTWRTSGIGAAWKCIDIVACSSRRIIDPVEAKPAADTTQHALQQLCPSCQHFNPWRNCGDAFHGLPSPFDPNPPPKAPAIDGWIHCPKCRTVVSAVAHECGRKMPADFDALVSHWTEEYERVEGRAEFAESLLCAMAFDSARNAYDGGTCSAQLLRHHEDECVFCDASRAVRHSCQVTP